MDKQHPACLYKTLVVGVAFLFLLITLSSVVGVDRTVSKAENISKSLIDEVTVEVLVEICGTDESKPFNVNLTLEELEELKKLFDDYRARVKASGSSKITEKIFKDAVVELEKFGILGDFSVKETQSLVLGDNSDSTSLSDYKSQNGKYNRNCQIIGETTKTGFFSENSRLKDWLLYFYWAFYIISRIFILSPITVPLGLFIIYLDDYHGIFILDDLIEFLHPILGKPLNKRISLFGNLFPFEYSRSITLGHYSWGGGGKDVPSKGWVWTNGSNGVVEWEGDTLWGDTGLAWGSLEMDIWYTEAVQNFRGINIFTGYWIEKTYGGGNEVLKLWVLGDAYFFGKADFVKISYDLY